MEEVKTEREKVNVEIKFNGATKLSNSLFDGTRRFKLSANAIKLLFTIAQSLRENPSLFAEIRININCLTKSLGLKDENNGRYEYVRDAFLELSKNPLEKYEGKKWHIAHWVAEVKFDGTEVEFYFTKTSQEVLTQMMRYVELKPKHYCNLSMYAAYLYPLLKNELFMSSKHSTYTKSVEKDIEFLKSYTFCHDKYKNNVDFFRNVLGIEKKDDEWLPTIRPSKDNLLEISPIQEINNHTDITVTATPLKRGAAYNRVKFAITLKSEAAQERQERNAAIKEKKKELNKELNINKSNDKFEVSKKYHASQIIKEAAAAGVEVDKYAKLCKLTKKGNYYLLFKKKEKNLFSDVLN